MSVDPAWRMRDLLEDIVELDRERDKKREPIFEKLAPFLVWYGEKFKRKAAFSFEKWAADVLISTATNGRKVEYLFIHPEFDSFCLKLGAEFGGYEFLIPWKELELFEKEAKAST